MQRLGDKLVRNDESIWHWCPACKIAHRYDMPRWTFNGNIDRPSFTPSMLSYVPNYNHETKKFDDNNRHVLCHYYLTDGYICYCSDSPHALKGEKVPLPDFPAGYSICGFIT